MLIAVLTFFSWFALCMKFSACLTWTKYPDSVTLVWNGETVTLKWDYSLTTEEQNAANIAISRLWERGNQSHLEFVASKMFMSGQSVSYSEDFEPHITVSRSEEATLIINEVAKQDEGVYKFTLRFLTLGDRHISRNISLEVRVKPTLQCPKKVSVKQGEQGIIPCNDTGDPKPNITWTKDLHVVSHNLTLVIDNASISDGGTYNVIANNGRSASVLVELDILFAPQKTNLTIESNLKNTTVLLNSNLTLLCVTDANPPALYHLYFNESYIGNSTSGVVNITVKGGGAYTCVPINTIGRGNNDTLNIIAVVPPSVKISNKRVIAVEGDRLNFTCSESGQPRPKIAWTKVGNATVMADTPSVSVIVDIPGTADNMIQYHCTASNGVGTPATATVNITVYYKPSTATSSKTVDVEVGEDTSIPCLEVIGNPPAAISWYRGNATSGNNITNNLDLIVKYANESDAGWYTCFAENVAGNATFKVLVRVVPRTTPTTVPSTVPATFPKTPSVVSVGEFNIKLTITNRDCSNNLREALQLLQSKVGEVLKLEFPSLKAVEATKYKCGSITVYLLLKFSQDEEISKVLSVLSKAVTLGGKGIGDFAVDPGSIQAISVDEIPSDAPSSTTKTTISSEEPTEMNICECSCKHVLLGSIIGVLLLFNIILVIHVVWNNKKETAAKRRPYEDTNEVYDNEVPMKDEKADRSYSRQFVQSRAEYMDLKEIRTERNIKEQRAHQVADYAPLHPSTRSWEVPRDCVSVEKIIGKGAFGQVAKGTAEQLRGRPGITTVAIKMHKSNAAESDKRDLMAELDTMKQLKPHPHVIKLLGCVTESGELIHA